MTLLKHFPKRRSWERYPMNRLAVSLSGVVMV
jgi:hypothetical protein